MGLIEIWTESPQQLEVKHIQQIIAFAGCGKLQDGNDASQELREFLAQVPSRFLRRYASECLTTKYEGSGLVLQDVINQVGKRLGFSVSDGRYRGIAGHIGFDGLWRTPDGHTIIVEVKTTDAYRIDLNVIAGYRWAFIKKGEFVEDRSSVLIVVGREDTGDLEAQIRGSRHAWDMRLISVDALIHLMDLTQEVEDPRIARKIRDILIPREFTKVDEIIDIVFSTAENVQTEKAAELELEGRDRKPKFVPVSFHDACIARIQTHLKRPLIKRTRANYSSPDGVLAVICAVSREHDNSGASSYWFAFHPHQKETLDGVPEGYLALGCGSEKTVLLISFRDFSPWLDGMNTTKTDDRFYWHISIFKDDNQLVLHRKKGHTRVDLTKYLLR